MSLYCVVDINLDRPSRGDVVSANWAARVTDLMRALFRSNGPNMTIDTTNGMRFRPMTRAGTVFPVLVTKDGGNRGNSSQNCSWTYTVYRLDDSTVIGTTMSPLRPRNPRVGYFYGGEARPSPASDTTTRLGYAVSLPDIDGEGITAGVHLLEALGEIIESGLC